MTDGAESNISQIGSTGFQDINNSSIEIQGGITTSTEVKGDLTGGNKITITNYYYYGERTTTSPPETLQEESRADLPSPYRGLYHFGPDDAEVFFGRDVFTQKLVDLAQKQNFIAVLGASGSGKSSVVLAGLVPELAKTGRWKFTHFRPGDDPFYTLSTALVPLYEPHLNKTQQILQARQLADALSQGFLLTDIITAIRTHPQNRVLLIADQFEELYTLCPNEILRHRFLDSLIHSIQLSSSKTPYQQAVPSPLVLVLTMRADFLGQAATYRPFVELLQDRTLILGPMNREELTEAIATPPEKVGVSFEAGLVERILDDIKNQPGSLPLLEFSLDLMWKKRESFLLTHSAYTTIGRLSGAISDYAEQIFANLNDTEQKQARHIFLRLIRPGEGTEDTRRLALKSELGEDCWPLIKQLADDRLVVTSRNSIGEETVEVVHEALIRVWKRLRNWIEEDRAFLTWYNRLRFSLDQWLKSGQDEGALLRGALLTEAADWLAVRRDDLERIACDFILTSVKLRDEEQGREEEARRSYLALEIINDGAQGRDLHEIDLKGTKLRKVNLSRANLSRANLSRADLTSANLNKANLSGTDLRDANLKDANLRETEIDETTQIDEKWRLVWEIINQGAVGRDLSGADLSGADLRAVNLRKINLNGAELSEANLREANLSKANLFGANLSGANLTEANLFRANLVGTNLVGANLNRADLSGTDLSRGNLSRADLREAYLSWANLREAKIDNTTRIAEKWRLVWEIINQGIAGRNLSRADLSEANLNSADLSRANLSRSNLSGANLNRANLSGTNLNGANLNGANLSSTDLSVADLRDADLNGANLREAGIDNTTRIAEKWRLVWEIINQRIAGRNLSRADLSGANLNGANLRGVNLNGANLNRANLREADLREAYLSWANLREAKIDNTTRIAGKWRLIWKIINQGADGIDLRGADLSGADLRGVNLSGADLSGANLSNSDLCRANLKEADLSKTNLRETEIDNATQIDEKWRLVWKIINQGPIGRDPSGSNLSGIDLSKADLSRADLSRVNLSRSDLSGADLREANLRETDLSGTNLKEANLQRTNLREAKIDETTQIDKKWPLVWEIINQGAIGRDLSGADLSGADLREANLSRANLSRADLTGANLNKANLSGTDLRDANLKDADLREAEIDETTQIDKKWRLVWEIINQGRRSLNGANLSGANLSGVNLFGAYLNRANLNGTSLNNADLSGADLREADLTGANLREADLAGANLRNAKINHTTQIDEKWRLVWEIINQGGTGRNLSRADLSRANLDRINLSIASLSEADLNRASLSGSNLSGANLRKADLAGANLSSANLSGADLREANLRGANLRETNLKETDLTRANLSEADLTRATLRGATLSGTALNRANLSRATLREANLSGTDLSGANLSGANMTRANLSGANVSGVILTKANLDGANLSETNLNGAKYDRITTWPDKFDPEIAGAMNIEIYGKS